MGFSSNTREQPTDLKAQTEFHKRLFEEQRNWIKRVAAEAAAHMSALFDRLVYSDS